MRLRAMEAIKKMVNTSTLEVEVIDVMISQGSNGAEIRIKYNINDVPQQPYVKSISVGDYDSLQQQEDMFTMAVMAIKFIKTIYANKITETGMRFNYA